MPGETSKYKVPYALKGDKPPSVPVITKAMAERVEALLPTVQDTRCTAKLTLTEEEQLIPGMKLELTPEVDSDLLVWLTVSFVGLGPGSVASGTIFLNGVEQVGGVFRQGENNRAFQSYHLSLNAKTKYVIEAKAYVVGGSASIEKSPTHFMSMLVAR